MKHPPYHLKLNKAVDRFTLIELIQKLSQFEDLTEYTYYGLGGPYLEDFRLLYDYFPQIRMVSIEKNKATLARQKFHLPCGKIHLEPEALNSFLATYNPRDKKSIFWLDYTNLRLSCFEEFKVLLEKVPYQSVLKISLQCDPRNYLDKPENFALQFADIMPDASITPPIRVEFFAKLLQDMLQISVQQILSAAIDKVFQPLSSFYYEDETGMFTLTGIVCKKANQMIIRRSFKDLAFLNLNWTKPKLIDLPYLSTKERLLLQPHLPCVERAGAALLEVLGYNIDETKQKSTDKLSQYADFHRYYPYFIKATP